MAINQNQMKISVLAKDFNIKSKDIVDILAAAGIDSKTSGTIGPEEYSHFFDRLTTANQITHMSDYLAGKADIERPRIPEAPKSQEKPLAAADAVRTQEQPSEKTASAATKY